MVHLTNWAFVPYCRPRIFLKALKRRYKMGKVTYKELPKDHPIFKAGWLVATTKLQSQKVKSYENEKPVRHKKSNS